MTKEEKAKAAELTDRTGAKFKSSPTVLALNLLLILGLIAFLMVAFFFVPQMTLDQRQVIGLIYPLLAGIAGGVMTGTAVFEIKSPASVSWPVTASFSAGLAIFALTYSFPPQFIREAVLPQPPVSNDVIRVALFYPADMTYGRNIKSGFVDLLKHSYPNALVEEHPSYANIPIAGGVDQKNSNAAKLISTRDNAKQYDYLVTVGTQASEALRKELAQRFGETPFIFAGVTDPVRSGLVSSLVDRHDARNVGGVDYGYGIDQLLSMAVAAFSTRRFVFLYDASSIQDQYVVDRLRSLPITKSSEIKIVNLGHSPTLADFPDRDAVYLGWHTLEGLFDSGAGTEILKSRIVVATTEKNVLIEQQAPISIAPSDEEIGRLATKLLVEHATGVARIGEQSVVTPTYYYTINFDTCREKHIVLPPGIIARARTKIGSP